MRKTGCLITFIIVNLFCYGQNISVYGGANENHFYDRTEESPHNHSEYGSARGFDLGIGIDSIRMDWMKCSFTLGVSNFGGSFLVRSGGQGGSNSIEGKTNNTTFTIGVYPVHFRIKDVFVFRFGLMGNVYLIEHVEGVEKGYVINGSGYNRPLDDERNKYSSNFSMGLSGKVMLNFRVFHLYHIQPYYQAYLGLGSDFRNYLLGNTKSYRYGFGLSVSRKINLYKK